MNSRGAEVQAGIGFLKASIAILVEELFETDVVGLGRVVGQEGVS